MRIVVFGASGTIGSAVAKEFSSRHEIVKVGKHSGDFQCEITDEKSIRTLFEKLGPFDALVSAVGNVHFATLETMTSELYQIGLKDKLMGQVNLVLIGKKYIRGRGSFTLISGILSDVPIAMGSSASMVDGALESFVKAAAIEMTHRINIVSPTIITESLPKYGPFFQGFESVPVSRVALAYSKSVEGLQTGQIYKVV